MTHRTQLRKGNGSNVIRHGWNFEGGKKGYYCAFRITIRVISFSWFTRSPRVSKTLFALYCVWKKFIEKTEKRRKEKRRKIETRMRRAIVASISVVILVGAMLCRLVDWQAGFTAYWSRCIYESRLSPSFFSCVWDIVGPVVPTQIFTNAHFDWQHLWRTSVHGNELVERSAREYQCVEQESTTKYVPAATTNT